MMDLATDYAERHARLDLLEILISSLASRMDLEELEADYLCSIALLIPAHATAIYFFKPTDLKPVHIAATGVDEGFLSYYETRGREVDPLRQWITENRRPYQSQLLLGLKGWQHHPVYRVVGTADIDFAMQSPITSGPDIIGTLNFGRQVSEGAFSELDLRAISIISQFLGLAAMKILGCSNLGQQQERFCEAISRIHQGVVIADRENMVRYTNKAARHLAQQAFGPDQPAEQLSRILQEDGQSQPPSDTGGKKQLSLHRYPLPGSRLPYTLVLLNETAPPPAFSWLTGILTRREMDVLKLVERGLQNQDIADELYISINTVKRHLDNIYCKLNVNSRAELVAKVYRLTYAQKVE